MLVVGALIQIVAFLVECLAPPFPAFALSFTLAGMGNVFQVNVIYIHEELRLIISLSTRSSQHLQMPSSQFFKRTVITNKVIYRLHMVHLSPQYINPTLTYFIQFIRRWSISCSPIRYILRSINNTLVASLSCPYSTSRFECGKSCGSF